MGSNASSIVLFTLLTKSILFPAALWTQSNGVRVAELILELNHLKIKYYGDRDTIAEEARVLYKKADQHHTYSAIYSASTAHRRDLNMLTSQGQKGL